LVAYFASTAIIAKHATQHMESSARVRKLGEIVAARLLEEIRVRGWPIGQSLGTEADLMTRFRVSRATMGEAIRQIEHYGAVMMRRGGGGGLVVTSSASTALARAITTYLEFSNVSVRERYEAARVLEPRAAAFAAERITDQRIVALRYAVRKMAAAGNSPDLHRFAARLRLVIAGYAASRPILLFMHSMPSSFAIDGSAHAANPSGVRELNRATIAELHAIVEAIVAGNVSLAFHHVNAHLDTCERQSRTHDFVPLGFAFAGAQRKSSVRNTSAERVAHAIQEDILRARRRTGDKLGAAPDLPRRYGASLWVLRQAVGILEPSGIVLARRGNEGGLYVGQPSQAHTVETAVSYLNAHQNPSCYQLGEYARARGYLSAFWTFLAQMAKSQVLKLFAAIVRGYLASREETRNSTPNGAAHLAVAQAIGMGDAPLAQRRAAAYFNSPK
jgi:DNA-binding FadR family transcriptional regulator